jgi:hypothetical protein
MVDLNCLTQLTCLNSITMKSSIQVVRSNHCALKGLFIRSMSLFEGKRIQTKCAYTLYHKT